MVTGAMHRRILLAVSLILVALVAACQGSAPHAAPAAQATATVAASSIPTVAPATTPASPTSTPEPAPTGTPPATAIPPIDTPQPPPTVGQPAAPATIPPVAEAGGRSPAMPAGLEAGRVVRVVDGDTVDVQLGAGVERLRLVGMDTPEVVDPRTPVQCFGREASARAHALLDGQTVQVEADAGQGERDKYGRLLRYLWLPDGRLFEWVMVSEGYAHEYTYDLPYTYQQALKAAQHDAAEQGRGLWAPDTCAGDTTQAAADLTPRECDAGPCLAPTAAPVGGYQGPYDPHGPDRDCADFATHAEAQAFYVAAGGPATDRHRLDGDHDGVACENLP